MPRAGEQRSTRPRFDPRGCRQKDEHFVDSILRPSKEISKGFESTKILTSEGRVITGRLIRETPDQIELRDQSGTNRLIKVAKGDIERIEQDTVSAMPEKLADQLIDRQQFLDLVKYVMEIADTGPPIDDSGPLNIVDRGKIEDRIHGLALLDRFGCVNCHRDDTDWIPQKQGPALSSATARVDPRFIQRFIADPLNVKPGPSMPNMMAHLPGKVREEASGSHHALLDVDRRQPLQTPVHRLDVGEARTGTFPYGRLRRLPFTEK